jgi:hypothetical protein
VSRLARPTDIPSLDLETVRASGAPTPAKTLTDTYHNIVDSIYCHDIVDKRSLTIE